MHQMYRPQLIPPGEFGGTSLASPRRKIKTPGMHRSEGASHLNSRVTSAVPDAARSVHCFRSIFHIFIRLMIVFMLKSRNGSNLLPASCNIRESCYAQSPGHEL